MINLFSKLHPAKLLGLATLSLALHAAPAAAATFNVGDLNAATPYSVVVSNVGSFEDIFNFSLNQHSAVTGSDVSLNLSVGPFTYLHISNPSLALYNAANPLVSLITGSTSFDVSSLAAGNYFVRVKGTADGAAGGMYLFGLAASPAPEPEQWMLFAAGLLAVGGIARRRV